MYQQLDSARRFVIQGFDYPNADAICQSPPIVFAEASDVLLETPAARTSLEGALITAQVIDEGSDSHPPHLLSLIDLAFGRSVEQTEGHWQLLRVTLSPRSLQLEFYDQSILNQNNGHVRLVLQHIQSSRLFCSLTQVDPATGQTISESYRLNTARVSGDYHLDVNCTVETRAADRALQRFDAHNLSMPSRTP